MMFDPTQKTFARFVVEFFYIFFSKVFQLDGVCVCVVCVCVVSVYINIVLYWIWVDVGV